MFGDLTYTAGIGSCLVVSLLSIEKNVTVGVQKKNEMLFKPGAVEISGVTSSQISNALR